MLLVGPGGQNAKVMSDAGGSLESQSVNLMLDDEAATQLPDSAQITSGSYRPADYEPGTDVFPAPAPAPSGNVNLSTFDGLSANGTWNLYLVDDAGADMGNLTGWSLTITTSGGPPPPPPHHHHHHLRHLRLRRHHRLRHHRHLGPRTTTSSTQSSCRGAERSAAPRSTQTVSPASP